MDCSFKQKDQFHFDKREHFDVIDWHEEINRKSTKTLLKLLNQKGNPEKFDRAIKMILRNRGISGFN